MKLSLLASSFLLWAALSASASANSDFFPQKVLNYFQDTSSPPAAVDLNAYNYSQDHGLSESTINNLFTLHKFLIATPSVSYDEYEVAQKLSHYLQKKGLTVELQKVAEKRFNVLAYKGSINDTRVVLNSHIDTVPPFFPYSIEENGTKIFGRGSTDAKGSVATQTIAFLELLDEVKEGDVSLLFVVGEENGGDGFRYSVEETTHKNWESVIFGEPTENKLGVGHKGIYATVLNVTGLASHSGYPELGIDANKILIDVLHNLKSKSLPSDELLGNSTLNIGLFEGGFASNIISPTAHASLVYRVAGGLDKFLDIIQQAIEEVNATEHVSLESRFGLDPVFFDYKVDGFESILLGYGTDAFSLNKSPVAHKFLYGPGTIHVAHSATEHVYTDDLLEAVDGYKRLIKHALSL
jgi:acetylornithine deacetylase